MKLVKAIIRPECLSDVLTALYRVDIHGLTVSRCVGHGGETEAVETYRGTTVKMGYYIEQGLIGRLPSTYFRGRSPHFPYCTRARKR